MNIHLKTIKRTKKYLTIRVLMNETNCGDLIMTLEEAHDFHEVFKEFQKNQEFYSKKERRVKNECKRRNFGK